MTIGKSILLSAVILVAAGAMSQEETPQDETSSPGLDKIEKRINELQT